MIVYLMKLFYS